MDRGVYRGPLHAGILGRWRISPSAPPAEPRLPAGTAVWLGPAHRLWVPQEPADMHALPVDRLWS